MTQTLYHSPADILRRLLVDLSVGTLPTDGGDWPINVSAEQDLPDNQITVYDTAGSLQGRLQQSGNIVEFPGLQIRVRAVSHVLGWNKVNAIATTLDQSARRVTVTIGEHTYLVHAVNRSTPPIPLGKETNQTGERLPMTKRQLFVINATITVKLSS